MTVSTELEQLLKDFSGASKYLAYDEDIFRAAQLCKLALECLSDSNPLHRFMFFFKDQNNHSHNGFDLGYSPTIGNHQQPIKIAMRLPTHTRQVKNDADLEATIAFSGNLAIKQTNLYRFAQGANELKPLGITPQWVVGQTIIMLRQGLMVAPLARAERFKEQLTNHPHLLSQSPNILVVTSA